MLRRHSPPADADAALVQRLAAGVPFDVGCTLQPPCQATDAAKPLGIAAAFTFRPLERVAVRREVSCRSRRAYRGRPSVTAGDPTYRTIPRPASGPGRAGAAGGSTCCSRPSARSAAPDARWRSRSTANAAPTELSSDGSMRSRRGWDGATASLPTTARLRSTSLLSRSPAFSSRVREARRAHRRVALRETQAEASPRRAAPAARSCATGIEARARTALDRSRKVPARAGAAGGPHSGRAQFFLLITLASGARYARRRREPRSRPPRGGRPRSSSQPSRRH